jgi:hypothetical protein
MRKLPIFKVLGHAVVKPLINWRTSLLMSFPLILVCVFAALLVGVTAHSTSPLPHLIGAILFYVGFLYFLSNWAVNWHRFVLLDEAPQGPFSSRGPTWGYLGNIIIVGFVLGLMEIPFKVITHFLERNHNAELASIISLVVTPIIFWWSFRLSTKLPAVALRHRNYGVWDAWSATSGNFWRFMGLNLVFITVSIGAVVLSILPIASTPFGLAAAFSYFAWPSVLFLIVPAICIWLYLSFGISILTALYGYFGEGREFVGFDFEPVKPKNIDDWSWNKKPEPIIAPVEEAPAATAPIKKPSKPRARKAVKKPAKKTAKKSK